MNDPNPYDAPSVTEPAADAQLLAYVAARLSAARENPPTVISTLTTWPGVPLLLVTGIVGTAILAALTTMEGSPLTSHWAVGMGSAVFGAILRDFGMARRSARWWPAQAQFIAWEKVEQYTR